MVMDSKIELNVSCNINSELSEQEILNMVTGVCNSLGLTVSRDKKTCIVSLKNISGTMGKKVLIYKSRYLKSGQYLSDMLKTIEGVTVFFQGSITVIVAFESDIKLISEVLASIDRDIFTGYVYSFIVCNNTKEFMEKIKTVLLNVSSRYEEHIQLIPVTDNVLMVLSMSRDYLRYIEMLSSLMDRYINQDLPSYSVKVRYRSVGDALAYVKSMLGEAGLSSDTEQNVIYFSGNKTQFEKLMRLISAYDKMPYQLLVRLYMIDIKSNNSLNAGTDRLVDSGSFGLGQTELLSLQWNKVNLFSKTIIIQESKNGKPRTVPLTKIAINILIEKSNILNIKSNLVFLNSVGNKIDKDNLRRVFEKVLQKAGLDNFHFHNLRHTFATRLAQKGLDIYTISKLLGHKDIRMTQRYAHHCPESLRVGVQLLEVGHNSVITGETRSVSNACNP